MRRMYHYNSICEVQDVRKVVAKGKKAEERYEEVECGGEDETKKENDTVDDLEVVVVVVEAEQEIG